MLLPRTPQVRPWRAALRTLDTMYERLDADAAERSDAPPALPGDVAPPRTDHIEVASPQQV